MTDDAQFQYVQGQSRAGWPALLAACEAESLAAARTPACALDLRYGPAERQTLDFFPAAGRARGTLVYFHAGYWQSRDKSTFRFIAPAFNRAGLNVALANYPLCPAVTLAALVESTKAAIPAIRAHAAAAQAGGAPVPLVASGHSAGAHIAVELALACSPDLGLAGVAALSGIYDLAPLVATSLNDALRLDGASAAAGSPLHRIRSGAAPVLVAVGGDETPAFVEQSRRLHAAWDGAGNASQLHVEAQADHFSLLRRFADPASELFGKTCALFEGPAGTGA